METIEVCKSSTANKTNDCKANKISQFRFIRWNVSNASVQCYRTIYAFSKYSHFISKLKEQIGI